MAKFIAEQFFLTTLDEERNHFVVIHPYGSPTATPGDNSILPAGLYRVVDGELLRIERAAPTTGTSVPNEGTDD